MVTVRQLTDIRKETPRNRDRDTEGDKYTQRKGPKGGGGGEEGKGRKMERHI